MVIVVGEREKLSCELSSLSCAALAINVSSRGWAGKSAALLIPPPTSSSVSEMRAPFITTMQLSLTEYGNTKVPSSPSTAQLVHRLSTLGSKPQLQKVNPKSSGL